MAGADSGHKEAAGHSEAAGHKQAGHASGRHKQLEVKAKVEVEVRPNPQPEPEAKGDAPQHVEVAHPAVSSAVMPKTAPKTASKTAPEPHDPVAPRAAPSPKHSAPARSMPQNQKQDAAAAPPQRSGWEDIDEVEEEDAAAFLARTEIPASATSVSRTSSPSPAKIPHVPIGFSSPPEKMHAVPPPAERVETSPAASALRRTTTAVPRGRPRKDGKIEF